MKCRVLGIKHRALQKNIEFNIDENYIRELLDIQNYKCYDTGLTLKLEYYELNGVTYKEKEYNKELLSIKRINDSKGYIKGNIKLCVVNNGKLCQIIS